MFIWKAMDGHKQKIIVRLKFQKRSALKFVSRTIPHSGGYNTPKLALGFIPVIAVLCLFVTLGLLIPSSANSCSCIWVGPFLKAAQNAPLIVIGKIIRHHSGKFPTMDVLVLETLKGGILDSGLTIQMGDGMYCRPTIDVFPVGTKWILAINGLGAKPGSGWAISHCGEYWLKVEDDFVVGSIDGDMKQVKRMPLQEFKNRFLYPKFSEKFSGRVEAGKQYRRTFGSRFEFILEPMTEGWQIFAKEFGRDENLARLTPPFHFVPNPREIEGWQFLDKPSECVNRPYQADAGPANLRQFIVRLKFQKRSELTFVSRTIPQSGGYNTPKLAFGYYTRDFFTGGGQANCRT